MYIIKIIDILCLRNNIIWAYLSDNQLDRKRGRNDFKFSKLLDEYLKEKLSIEKEIKSKPAEGARLSKSDLRRIRNNDDKKVRTLNNHIFRSMANLIHFFEFINKHSSVFGKYDEKTKLYKGLFDDDIEELFGFKGPYAERYPINDAGYLVFVRLMNTILQYPNRNIKFQLARTMAHCVTQAITAIAWEKNRDPDTSAIRSPIGQIMSDDLLRTRIWAEHFTSEIRVNKKEPRRMIGF